MGKWPEALGGSLGKPLWAWLEGSQCGRLISLPARRLLAVLTYGAKAERGRVWTHACPTGFPSPAGQAAPCGEGRRLTVSRRGASHPAGH